jgi:tRNA nucleotidyltransferase/poly(A) polymerase
MVTFELAPTARVYKVGGAVRDTLLNYPYSETDWVIVGATPEVLLASGFKLLQKIKIFHFQIKVISNKKLSL